MSKQNKRPKSKRKERFENLMARKGMSVVLILAVLILIVSIVSLSFSWFKPFSKEGRGASYSAQISIRSENCSITSYAGTAVTSSSDGKMNIDYDAPLTGNAQSVEVPANSIVYFGTKIKNNSDYPTNVSLYISEFPSKINNASPPNSFTAVGLGVATPTNNYHEYTTKQPASGAMDPYIIRNIYVSVEDSANNDPGSTTIEWFVKNNSGSTVTVDLSKLYIMYN